MYTIGIDIGGTKISSAIFDNDGNYTSRISLPVGDKSGDEVGDLVLGIISSQIAFSVKENYQLSGIGLCVPGIYWSAKKTVWAPNIAGWDDYPLYDKIVSSLSNKNLSVKIDSDRACYILGEAWKGAASGAKNAIYMAVGTGIGLGILVNGEILRGANDIAGATGWMALERPYDEKYVPCGCFEYAASGAGLGRKAAEIIKNDPGYSGILKNIVQENIAGEDVFNAFDNNDPVAVKVIENAIELWGMAVANYVSLFNPEIIILGGGVFGPGVKFITDIFNEAKKWAQPWSINLVRLSESKLGSDAGLYGAGYLLRKFQK
ncbi:MAG: ROK family protein [Ignavibacteriaceae bacterium]